MTQEWEPPITELPAPVATPQVTPYRFALESCTRSYYKQGI